MRFDIRDAAVEKNAMRANEAKGLLRRVKIRQPRATHPGDLVQEHWDLMLLDGAVKGPVTGIVRKFMLVDPR